MRDMQFERSKSPLVRRIETVILVLFGGIVILSASMLGGFWWLFEGGNAFEGGWCLLMITAFAFNRVPVEGARWFHRNEVKYLYLPVWGVNVIGYLAGMLLNP